jgi:uncharacterized protein (DUF1501 family)
VLEGGSQPYQARDGWLNRLVAMLPRGGDAAIAIAPTVPPALRGPVQVASYAPSGLPDPADDLLTRVGTLYGADSQLRGAWAPRSMRAIWRRAAAPSRIRLRWAS